MAIGRRRESIALFDRVWPGYSSSLLPGLRAAAGIRNYREVTEYSCITRRLREQWAVFLSVPRPSARVDGAGRDVSGRGRSSMSAAVSGDEQTGSRSQRDHDRLSPPVNACQRLSMAERSASKKPDILLYITAGDRLRRQVSRNRRRRRSGDYPSVAEHRKV